MRWWVLFCVVVVSGCECGPPSAMDAGTDAGALVDAGVDAGFVDAGDVTFLFDGDFGAVQVGSTLDRSGTVNNASAAAAHLELSTDGGAFTVIDGGVLDVPAGSTRTFVVRFAPSAFGPVVGTLNFDDARLQLNGVGIGPSLRVPSSVDLGTVPLYAGSPAIAEQSVRFENVGLGADVQFSVEVVALTGDATELCVADCFPGVTRVAPGSPLDLSLKLTANGVGPRAFVVRVFSNDPVTPLQTFTVTADVVATPTCNFSIVGSADFGVLSENETRTLALSFENVGTEVCELTSASFAPTVPQALPLFSLTEPASFPVIVAPGFSQQLLVTARARRPMSANPFSSVLSVEVNSPMRFATATVRAYLDQSCAFVGLTRPLDFGDVVAGCSSAARPIQALSSNCNSPPSNFSYGSLGPQFQLTVPPLLPSIRFTPTATGSVRDVLRVDWEWAGAPYATTVELLGTGVASAQRTDSFTQGNLKTDILFVVAQVTGGPLESRLQSRLPPLLAAMSQLGIDAHLGVVPLVKTGDLGALRATSSGVRVLSPNTPNGAQLFTELLTTNQGQPSGDCKEAALRALVFPAIGSTNASFRRPGASLQIVCITDAPDTDDALGPQVMELARDSEFLWHELAPTFNATTHALLPPLTGGVRTDINGDWSAVLSALTSTTGRTRFTLRSPPDTLSLTVRIDGIVVPPTSGTNTVWSFDAASNAVVFEPLFVPAPGSVLELSYDAQCAP